jgi:hypothetical protein
LKEPPIPILTLSKTFANSLGMGSNSNFQNFKPKFDFDKKTQIQKPLSIV